MIAANSDRSVPRPDVKPPEGPRLEPADQDAPADLTPPPELQTDPDRGTGELGTEGLDPSHPLAKPRSA